MAPLAEARKLVVGERLALFNYYTVERVDEAFVHCADLRGHKVRIGREIVDHSMVSTSQHQRECRTTRAVLAQKIEGAGHAPMRITFRKQVKENDVADALADEDLGTQAKRRKLLKRLMQGERRVMHCKLKRSSEDDVQMELGRFRVDDLELYGKGGCTERLVDTRTVEEVVLEGVRYYAA